MPQEYFFILLFSLLLFRVVVIVFHEFGHAFATLLNSDGDVSVYIGSYGNPEKSFRFKVKRLECFIKYNIFKWKGGLCVPHEKNIPWKGRIWISLFGPLTTLIIGIIAAISLFFLKKYSISHTLLFVIAFSCILDFVFNIIPRKTQIQLHDGTFTNNDGKQLLHLWNIRKVYETYNKALKHYTEKEYAEAGKLFEKCVDSVSKDRELYRLVISSHLLAKNYDQAIEIQKVYSEKYENSFDVNDHVNLGVLEIYKKNYAKAFDLFDKALVFAPENVIILNNRGYALGLLDKHEEAIIDLDKSISIDEKFAYAWDNRGYSKIMLGQLEEGYTDLQKSLELDDKNSYVYCNIGIYHFKKQDYQKALEYYHKAYDLDPHTIHIEKYMEEVKQFL